MKDFNKDNVLLSLISLIPYHRSQEQRNQLTIKFKS